MGKAIEIAIVDDHQMFADGLGRLISSLDGQYRCQTITSPLTAIRLLADGHHFDLIISDLIMDSLNGIAFIRALRNRNAKVPVLIISGINTAPPIEEALRLGAMGFLPKSASSEILAEALGTVLSGEIYLPPRIWTAYEEQGVPSRSKDDASPIGPELSDRQTEVLQLISEGYSNRVIALMLDVSENTVKTHIKRIFKLFDVNTRAACVKKAQAAGLIG